MSSQKTRLIRGKYSYLNDEIREIYADTEGFISDSAIAKIIIEKHDEGTIVFESLRKYIGVYMKEVLSKEDMSAIKNRVTSESVTQGYEKTGFVLSAWNHVEGKMMDIDTYCEHYNLPRKDISSYKLVSHTGTPYYNVVFKENMTEEVFDFNFDDIAKKHINPVTVVAEKPQKINDFDALTFTDVHIGMDTNKDGNSMYPSKWDEDEIMKSADLMVAATIKTKSSPVLVIDELGDLLDGFNAQTVRGGHALPQNMTNEEAFDCAVAFKMRVVDGLVAHYDKIICNNICNDNHAGAFGYFANQMFKSIAEIKYNNIEVRNHRQFMNHYFMGKIAFIITHGKDDSALKFGFKPKLDSAGLERIDQYCKQNDIYKKADLIVFKKGDSHQTLLDMCTSDDFYYFNYGALSPSSKWVQTNYKKGRKGFMIEKYNGLKLTIEPEFL